MPIAAACQGYRRLQSLASDAAQSSACQRTSSDVPETGIRGKCRKCRSKWHKQVPLNGHSGGHYFIAEHAYKRCDIAGNSSRHKSKHTTKRSKAKANKNISKFACRWLSGFVGFYLRLQQTGSSHLHPLALAPVLFFYPILYFSCCILLAACLLSVLLLFFFLNKMFRKNCRTFYLENFFGLFIFFSRLLLLFILFQSTPWQCDMCPRSGLAQQARERDRRRGPAGKGDSLEAFNPYSHFYMQSKAEATTKFFSFILFFHRFSLLFIFSITLALHQLEFHIHIFPLRFCRFWCEFCHAFDLGFPR